MDPRRENEEYIFSMIAGDPNNNEERHDEDDGHDIDRYLNLTHEDHNEHQNEATNDGGM